MDTLLSIFNSCDFICPYISIHKCKLISPNCFRDIKVYSPIGFYS